MFVSLFDSENSVTPVFHIDRCKKNCYSSVGRFSGGRKEERDQTVFLRLKDLQLQLWYSCVRLAVTQLAAQDLLCPRAQVDVQVTVGEGVWKVGESFVSVI